MDKNLDIRVKKALRAYLTSGVEDQVDYQKFYLYSIVTHSTAIEGYTVTEIENQFLFDEGIAVKERSLIEQMINVDLKDTYLHAFKIASENPTYTPGLFTTAIGARNASDRKRILHYCRTIRFIKREGSDKTDRWIILK